MQKPKSFRPWQPDQATLLPLSTREWLAKDYQLCFLLDLSEILIMSQAKDPRGEKVFDPRRMMLLYAYCVGTVSLRKIELACYEDLPFRGLTGNQPPAHLRISDFRRRNLDALKSLFVQILRLCQKAGMVSLEQVALDGNKLNVERQCQEAKGSKARQPIKATKYHYFLCQTTSNALACSPSNFNVVM